MSIQTIDSAKQFDSNSVYIYRKSTLTYPSVAPYNPSSAYPEYPFKSLAITNEENGVYPAVRETLNGLGFDTATFGTPQWNPLGSFVKPGNTVLIKPNMVRHFHSFGYTMDCLVTHGSIIRAICDYVIIALQGTGTIVIADAPIQSADFKKIADQMGLHEIKEFYQHNVSSIKIDVIDFRTTVATVNSRGLFIKSVAQKGDPSGYINVNVGSSSQLEDVAQKAFGAPDYPNEITTKAHRQGRHNYLIPCSVLNADVIINMPKPKTHRFAGLTGAMKNFIGIIGEKNTLAHYTLGAKASGGDEFPEKSIRKKTCSWLGNLITRSVFANKFILSIPLMVIRKAINMTIRDSDLVYRGCWPGNDTIWRTIADVNNIALYADKNGTLQKKVQRIIFTLADGVIMGENYGPLEPDPKPMGMLIAGFNGYLIDYVLAKIMKFRPDLIPSVHKCPKELGAISESGIAISSNDSSFLNIMDSWLPAERPFIPVPGWEILSEGSVADDT